MVFSRLVIHKRIFLRFFGILIPVLMVQLTLPVCSRSQETTAITPDGTMSTIVNQTGTIYDITGGTRPDGGANLFHSFGEFGVPTDNIANFLNDSPVPTTNILSRVTGGNPSNIFGTIQTQGFGNANLFLMNPAGIVFGPDAALNVGGSTHFTTADYLRLADGVQFTALPGAQDAVLSVAPFTAFGFLGATPNSITVDGSALSVTDGEAISLVGGALTIGSNLKASGGQVALASVASSGEVLADTYASAPNVDGQSFTSMGNLSLLEGTTLDVSGDLAGTVKIRSGQLMVDGATISANTLEPASGLLEPPGAGIDITTTGDLLVNNGGLIEANVSGGSMAGGDILLNVGQNLEIRNGSMVHTLALSGSGHAGNIEVNANRVLISDASQGFESVTFGAFMGNSTGNAGNISIVTKDLRMVKGLITATTVFGVGQGGKVDVNVQGGEIFLDESVISTNAIGSIGNAGEIEITARNVSLRNNANIESGSTFGATGNAGGVNMIVNGQLDIREKSAITVRSELAGVNGDLTISAEDIVITGVREGMFPLDGQQGDFTGFSTRTTDGEGGDMHITARSLQLTDKGFLNGSTDGSGTAGNIFINLSERLRIADGGEIRAITTGSGAAGQIEVVADAVELSGRNAFPFIERDGTDALAFARISTQTDASGTGGTIGITAKQIDILDGGSMTSNSLGEGDGGSIRIKADTILISGENPSKTAFRLDPRSSITTENEGRIPGPEATGLAGDISLEMRDTLSLDGGLISARSGSAGSGGSIQVTTGDLSLSNDASISAQSTSTGNAGNINLLANNTIQVENSAVTTESRESSGGNIDLQAQELISLDNSIIESSVEGDATTVGGNISLDPEFIILRNSQILANAVEGQGGNISLIATNSILADPFSVLDASSALGVSGSVDIQAPIQNLSGTIAPLPEETTPVTSLYGARCAAGQGGHFSTFVNSKADSLSPIPGAFLASPLLSPSAQAQTDISAGPPQNPVVLTASIAPLVLGHASESTTACP